MKLLELGMEQLTGSKSGKEYVKAIYCHLAYLTYIQSTTHTHTHTHTHMHLLFFSDYFPLLVIETLVISRY